MTYYECNTCKEAIEAPIDVPTQMIGEWKEEKKNTYVFICLKCLNKEEK